MTADPTLTGLCPGLLKRGWAVVGWMAVGGRYTSITTSRTTKTAHFQRLPRGPLRLAMTDRDRAIAAIEQRAARLERDIRIDYRTLLDVGGRHIRIHQRRHDRTRGWPAEWAREADRAAQAALHAHIDAICGPPAAPAIDIGGWIAARALEVRQRTDIERARRGPGPDAQCRLPLGDGSHGGNNDGNRDRDP